MSATIGILALQGDVREHRRSLERVGATTKEVRRPGDLEALDGIILPGGESTTLSMLLDSSGVRSPLAAMIDNGFAVFGTCAGLILLATKVEDGRDDQRSFAAIDVTVRRNGYGGQLFSFETEATLLADRSVGLDAVFIRAPLITAVGAGVEVLATTDSPDGPRPVAVAQGSAMGAAFHPELTEDLRLHERFVAMAAKREQFGR